MRKRRSGERVRPRKARISADMYRWYMALKRHPCARCGFVGEPCQMDFDHRPGQRKLMEVSKMLRLGFSKAEILREVAKTQLLCANCHRWVTKERRDARGKKKNASQ